MTDAEEIFGAIAHIVDENTSEEGVDVINAYATMVEAMKQNPDMTLEQWELFRLSVNNGVAVFNSLIDEVIAELKSEAG